MKMWNRLAQNVNRMEKNASDMEILDKDPEQFRADHGGHLGVQLILLVVVVAVAAILLLTGN